MKNRIGWVDLLRGVGMFLVIIGHTLYNDFGRAIIYSFHMPLFFLRLVDFAKFIFHVERLMVKF